MNIKDNLKFIIKKIKMSKNELKLLEIKANGFDNAISKINGSIEFETEDAKNRNGNVIVQFTKSANYMANIDIRGLLDALYIKVGDCIQLNIIDTNTRKEPNENNL